MKRYCVSILFAIVSPMYNEIRCDARPHYFDSEEEATCFMRQQRRMGYQTTEVMDLKNLPF